MVTTDLDRRVIELETRLAFQEQALAELSDALAAMRLEAVRQAERVRQVQEEMKHSRGELFADASQEPPPPHY